MVEKDDERRRPRGADKNWPNSLGDARCMHKARLLIKDKRSTHRGSGASRAWKEGDADETHFESGVKSTLATVRSPPVTT